MDSHWYYLSLCRIRTSSWWDTINCNVSSIRIVIVSCYETKDVRTIFPIRCVRPLLISLVLTRIIIQILSRRKKIIFDDLTDFLDLLLLSLRFQLIGFQVFVSKYANTLVFRNKLIFLSHLEFWIQINVIFSLELPVFVLSVACLSSPSLRRETIDSELCTKTDIVMILISEPINVCVDWLT